MRGSLNMLNEWKFKEAYMKYKCGGEHMSAKERTTNQSTKFQNLEIVG